MQGEVQEALGALRAEFRHALQLTQLRERPALEPEEPPEPEPAPRAEPGPHAQVEDIREELGSVSLAVARSAADWRERLEASEQRALLRFDALTRRLGELESLQRAPVPAPPRRAPPPPPPPAPREPAPCACPTAALAVAQLAEELAALRAHGEETRGQVRGRPVSAGRGGKAHSYDI